MNLKGIVLSGVFFLVSPCLAADPELALHECAKNESDFKTQSGGCQEKKTGVVWGNRLAQSASYEEAAKACTESKAGGFTDWTLPTLEQLKRAVDLGAKKFFGFRTFDFFWAAETSKSEKADILLLASGEIIKHKKTDTAAAVCVRGWKRRYFISISKCLREEALHNGDGFAASIPTEGIAIYADSCASKKEVGATQGYLSCPATWVGMESKIYPATNRSLDISRSMDGGLLGSATFNYSGNQIELFAWETPSTKSGAYVNTWRLPASSITHRSIAHYRCQITTNVPNYE